MKTVIKVCAVIENKGKILLLKEVSKYKKGYYWNVVKGTYDNKKESIIDCAKREALEEVNLKIKIKHLISCFVFTENIVLLQFNLLASPANSNTPSLPDKKLQKQNGEDIVDIKWFSKKEALKIPKKDFINNRSYKIIRDWANKKTFSLEMLKSLE